MANKIKYSLITPVIIDQPLQCGDDGGYCGNIECREGTFTRGERQFPVQRLILSVQSVNMARSTGSHFNPEKVISRSARQSRNDCKNKNIYYCNV